MVNGLISQLVTPVIRIPFGLRPTFFTLLKSTFSIIRKIISQIRMATGMEHWRIRTDATLRNGWDILTDQMPATIQTATQSVSVLQKLIP